MRTVSGQIILPPNASSGRAHTVLIEVRDVSVADAPSTVVASVRLQAVELGPGLRLPFTVDLPETKPGRRLAMRVHVDVEGTGHVSSGDLLTTESIGVPPTGPADRMAVPVTRV